jgi:Nuclease-related domain
MRTARRRLTKREETYAESRYRRGVSSWRRWTHRRLLIIFAPIFIAAVLWGLAQQHGGAFLAGFIAGGVAAMFIAVREYAPAYVETWGQGCEGERKTHDVLDTLGWQFVDDVDSGHGNYDHLAVGPPGVFLIESKNLNGISEVRDGVAWLRRRHDPAADRACTRLEPSVLRASAEVSGAIREQTGRRVWVQALVVFWNEFPQGVEKAEKIAFVHGTRLRDYLQNMSPNLDQTSQEVIGDVIARLKRDGPVRSAT